MVTLIVIGSCALYTVIGSAVACLMAAKYDDNVFETDHPGFFFAGLLWPLVLPCLTGARIAKVLATPRPKELPAAKVVRQ